MKKYWKMMGAILIISLVIILAGITIAAAQDEPAPPDDPVTPILPEFPPPFQGGGRRGPGAGMGLPAIASEMMHATIADALGISVEAFEAAIAEGQTLFSLAQELSIDWADVQAAVQDAHQDALQAAVDEGLISQEQADWMADRGQMGPGGGFGGRFGGGPLGRGLMAVEQAEMHQTIAEALSISVAAFEAAIAEGQTPLSLAQELGIDRADVQTAMQDAHQDALQAAVDEGLISQEQADWMANRGQMGPGGGLSGRMHGGQFNGRPQGGPRGGGMRGGQFGGRW